MLLLRVETMQRGEKNIQRLLTGHKRHDVPPWPTEVPSRCLALLHVSTQGEKIYDRASVQSSGQFCRVVQSQSSSLSTGYFPVFLGEIYSVDLEKFHLLSRFTRTVLI